MNIHGNVFAKVAHAHRKSRSKPPILLPFFPNVKTIEPKNPDDALLYELFTRTIDKGQFWNIAKNTKLPQKFAEVFTPNTQQGKTDV